MNTTVSPSNKLYTTLMNELDFLLSDNWGMDALGAEWQEWCERIYRACDGFWGAQWRALSSYERMLIVVDFVDAHAEDEVSVPEYGRRIGKGGLTGYVQCQAARRQREAGVTAS